MIRASVSEISCPEVPCHNVRAWVEEGRCSYLAGLRRCDELVLGDRSSWRELGHPPSLLHDTVQSSGTSLLDIASERGRTTDDCLERREVELVNERMLRQSQDDGRDDVGTSHFVCLDELEILRKVEGGHKDSLRGMSRHCQQPKHQAVDMEEGERDKNGRVFEKVFGLWLVELEDIGDKVAMRENNSFREASGAAAEGNGCGRGWVDCNINW
jgi:hypothetical protein